jgi:hypothetical protein
LGIRQISKIAPANYPIYRKGASNSSPKLSYKGARKLVCVGFGIWGNPENSFCTLFVRKDIDR